ncbi:class I tRNA ligase family protein, partial [Staphylococcus aureus]|nr:class I tRNA ligase family protein [Staphylococcus aureus]
LANARHTDSIMIARWPVAQPEKIDAVANARMDAFKDMVNAIRNLRGEMNLGPAVKAPLLVEGPADYADFLPYARLLGRLSDAAM